MGQWLQLIHPTPPHTSSRVTHRNARQARSQAACRMSGTLGDCRWSTSLLLTRSLALMQDVHGDQGHAGPVLGKSCSTLRTISTEGPGEEALMLPPQHSSWAGQQLGADHIVGDSADDDARQPIHHPQQQPLALAFCSQSPHVKGRKFDSRRSSIKRAGDSGTRVCSAQVLTEDVSIWPALARPSRLFAMPLFPNVEWSRCTQQYDLHLSGKCPMRPACSFSRGASPGCL